jgi:ATP-dependent Clp protease protease subunit
MLFLESENRRRPIVLEINSPGGSITAGLAILDTMDRMKTAVHTHCYSQAAGIAAVIMAHGFRNWRTAVAGARFQLLLSSTPSSDSDALDERRRCDNILSEYLVNDTGRATTRVLGDMRASTTLTAAEAKQYGLIDHVLPALAQGQ